MDQKHRYWMEYSIKLSQKLDNTKLSVGAILTSEDNKILCTAFSGENSNMPWFEIIITKIKRFQISYAQRLYITVNTLSNDNSVDFIKILNILDVREIYYGLPDPNITYYLVDDPVLNRKNIYRYPDDLQLKILRLNEEHFKTSKQSIKYSHYYSNNRITDLLIKNLKLRGFVVDQNDINIKKDINFIASLISTKYNIKFLKAFNIVKEEISNAFNIKYGKYDYSNDVRSLNLNWKNNFISFFSTISSKPLSDFKILNIGVESGNEAICLFSECKNITFVDIAEDGLKKIKKIFTSSVTITANADNLYSITNDSYELYISLRTYNSSFFNIKQAILEAKRILKSNSLFIISIANGFLYSNSNIIIPGLIIPGTDFVDIYRPLNTINLIHEELLKCGFKDIHIFPTNTEIFLSAIKS